MAYKANTGKKTALHLATAPSSQVLASSLPEVQQSNVKVLEALWGVYVCTATQTNASSKTALDLVRVCGRLQDLQQFLESKTERIKARLST